MDIKTINEPKVYLVGRQTMVGAELDKFLADHQVDSWSTDTEVGAEALSEVAGRICYMSFAKPRPGGNEAYLRHLKEVGHGSCIEHSVWNLVFTGISRSLTHELVRHRAGMGYSQLSQRYVDESVSEYVVPPDLQLEVECGQCYEELFRESISTDEAEARLAKMADKYPNAAKMTWADFVTVADIGLAWLDAVETSHKAYVDIGSYLAKKAQDSRPDLTKTDARKYARQAARSVLPNATETKIFVTANARAFRHFIEMRASRHADPEIRILAHQVWKLLSQESPNLFGDYREAELSDGTFELTTEYRKV